MAHMIDTLGQRIVDIARLAVAMHLDQVAEAQSDRGQQVAIGRADSHRSRDGQLPAGGDRAGAFRRTPFTAEGAAG